MARVKRGTISIKHRRRILRRVKGFRWGRKSKERAAKQALFKAWAYATRDRKVRKREFRRLWQVRIGAALPEGLSYSRFIASVKKANIELDRKILSDLAQTEPAIFEKIVEMATK